MASNTLACELGIGAETLSAWRDGLLPAGEKERLRAHTPHCDACRRRLAAFDEVAQALRAQRELEPYGRIVEGVRGRLTRPARRSRARSRREIWSGLGALGAVAAVLLLFVYMFAGGPRGLPTGKPTPAVTKNITPIPTTSATFSPVTDVHIAWGTTGAVATVNTSIDDSHTFQLGGIMPGGKTLVGYQYTRDRGTGLWGITQVGLFDVATKRFTPIDVPVNPNYPPTCCQTDGRFVVVDDSDQPGVTGDILHERYWVYDLTTGEARQVATGGGTFEGILDAHLSHGLLALSTGAGRIEIADLTTRTITPLPRTAIDPRVLAFTWPYLVYSQYPAAGASSVEVLVHDFSTQRDTTLAALAHLDNASAGASMALVGDTLFYVTAQGDEQQVAAALHRVDHALSGTPHASQIALFPWDPGQLRDANARLVNFGTAAWDEAQGRFVVFESNTGGGGGYLMELSGDFLAVAQPAEAPGHPYVQQVTIYDTARLPVRT